MFEFKRRQLPTFIAAKTSEADNRAYVCATIAEFSDFVGHVKVGIADIYEKRAGISSRHLSHLSWAEKAPLHCRL